MSASYTIWAEMGGSEAELRELSLASWYGPVFGSLLRACAVPVTQGSEQCLRSRDLVTLERRVSPTEAHTVSAPLCNESRVGGCSEGMTWSQLKWGPLRGGGFPRWESGSRAYWKRKAGLVSALSRWVQAIFSLTLLCHFVCCLISVRLWLPPDLPLASPCLSKPSGAFLGSGLIAPGLHPRQPRLSPSPLNPEGTQWSHF